MGYSSPAMPPVHSWTSSSPAQALGIQVVPGALEELRGLLAPVLVKEGEETRGGALGGGHARQVEVRLVHGAARLFHGKGAQQEEGLAGQRGYPVRVAAPGVQQGARGALIALLGHLHQEVFHLEGRHGPEGFLEGAIVVGLDAGLDGGGESVAAVPAPWEVEGVEVLMGRPFSRWPHCAARERRCPSRAVTCKESENLEGSFWRSRLNCAQPLVQPHAVGYFHRSEALSSRSRHKSRSCSNSSL